MIHAGISGHFVVAPAGLVDSTLNAAHRAAASVDVAASPYTATSSLLCM